MKSSTRDIAKPRHAELGTPILVRLQPDKLAALDAWIIQQDAPVPTRPEAIRRLIDAALA